MNLGSALKEIRVRRGKTQIEVVEKVGLSQTYLSQIENGFKEPSPEMLRSLCKFYKMPVVAVVWMATESTDIPFKKRGAFIEIAPSVNELIESFFPKSNLRSNA